MISQNTEKAEKMLEAEALYFLCITILLATPEVACVLGFLLGLAIFFAV